MLYVALAMGAWCFLISAIVWCYCITSVGTEWGLTYGIKTIVGRDGARTTSSCCGCICDPRRCRSVATSSGTAADVPVLRVPRDDPRRGRRRRRGRWRAGGGAAEDGAAEADDGDDESPYDRCPTAAARHTGSPRASPRTRRHPATDAAEGTDADGGDGGGGGDGADGAGGDDAAAAAPGRAGGGLRWHAGQWVLWFGLFGLVGGIVATKIVWDDSNMPTETAIVLYAALGALLGVSCGRPSTSRSGARRRGRGGRGGLGLARLRAWSAARAPTCPPASTSRASRSSWSAAPSGRAAAASTRCTRGA